jgi:hypothetical protein
MKEIIIEVWNVILRIMWLCIFTVILILLLRMMAWSDTGMYGDGSDIEKTFIPQEVTDYFKKRGGEQP